MRDEARDAQSAEQYVTFTDADLVEQARTLNRRLIAQVAELSNVWDDATHARAQALARELQAIRYELVRRRIPNPSGASVTITGSTVAGVNTGDITHTGG